MLPATHAEKVELLMSDVDLLARCDLLSFGSHFIGIFKLLSKETWCREWRIETHAHFKLKYILNNLRFFIPTKLGFPYSLHYGRLLSNFLYSIFIFANHFLFRHKPWWLPKKKEAFYMSFITVQPLLYLYIIYIYVHWPLDCN